VKGDDGAHVYHRPDSNTPNGIFPKILRRSHHRLTAQEDLSQDHQPNAEEINQAHNQRHRSLAAALSVVQKHLEPSEHPNVKDNQSEYRYQPVHLR